MLYTEIFIYLYQLLYDGIRNITVVSTSDAVQEVPGSIPGYILENFLEV